MIQTKKTYRAPRKVVKVDTEQFLYEISKKPILYDKTLKDFKRFQIRNAAWNELGSIFQIKGEDAKLRWRSIRDGYLKHIRQTEMNQSERGNWIYFNSMEFLHPYIDRSRKRKYCAIKDEDDGEEQYSTDEVIVANTVETHSSETERIDNDELSPRKHLPNLEKTINEELEESEAEAVPDNTNYNMLVECLDDSADEDFVTNKLFLQENVYDIEDDEQTEIPEKQELLVQAVSTSISIPDPSGDDNEKFLLSCLPTMKRLTIRQNVLARLRIQQILYNIEFEEEQ